jgi:hypothetical protein
MDFLKNRLDINRVHQRGVPKTPLPSCGNKPRVAHEHFFHVVAGTYSHMGSK